MVEICLKNATLNIFDMPMSIQRSSDTIIPCLARNQETVDFSVNFINWMPTLPKSGRAIQAKDGDYVKLNLFNYSLLAGRR